MKIMKHQILTDSIICCFYNVYNGLGYGFLEKVYQKSLFLELESRGFTAKAEVPVKVAYRGQVVGDYFCDLLVEDKIILEIKSSKNLTIDHEAQLLNYLKATSIKVGLLLNFGPDPQIRRKVFSNDELFARGSNLKNLMKI
jgi:GxxExxY protein